MSASCSSRVLACLAAPLMLACVAPGQSEQEQREQSFELEVATAPGLPPGRYTSLEAAIRDCYDAYLDGLERFGSFLSTGLATVRTLRPYLGYWLDDLAARTKDPADAAWTAAVLTYIQFYKFEGVQQLMLAFGRDIAPGGRLYSSFTDAMDDKDLAKSLKRVALEASRSTPGQRQ